jgi:hypothetical protein
LIKSLLVTPFNQIFSFPIFSPPLNVPEVSIFRQLIGF